MKTGFTDTHLKKKENSLHKAKYRRKMSFLFYCPAFFSVFSSTVWKKVMCISCSELFSSSTHIYILTNTPVLWVFPSCAVDTSHGWPLLPCVTSVLLLLLFFQSFWKTNPGRSSPSDLIVSCSSIPFSSTPLASTAHYLGAPLFLCRVLHY